MKHKGPALFFVNICFVSFMLFCSFHADIACAAEWTCNCDPALCKAYNDAVAETAKPLTADKIYSKLTALVPENEDLIWENDEAGSRVLAVIYSWGLNPDPGELPNPNYALKTNKWVTVAPELYKFFEGKSFTDTRIEQLLGLPPCYGNTKIIEVYINPVDMFRPSPDPETTDQTASIEFPWRTSKIVSYDTSRLIYDDFCGTPPPCFSNYETWFTNRRSGVYSANPPFPWTGLGYTYDWKHSLAQHPQCEGLVSCYTMEHSTNYVGMSEFVVTPATIGVLRISEASDYFGTHKQTLTVDRTGSGKVTSHPNGINCGSHCVKSFKRYAKIRLTATSSSSAQFQGWEGACAYAGSNPVCTVTMVDNKTVEAVFSSN
jgi:hypothetical protein